MTIKDFTIEAYKIYLSALKKNYKNNLRFDEYMLLENKPQSFFLVRHDVDRKIVNSLRMAEIEYRMGIKSSYYFRMRSNTFKPDIIKKIQKMGHEVGYHYECLSDFDGDMNRALDEFKKNLLEFRKHVTIKTISMHGSPLGAFDNRDMWRVKENYKILLEELDLLGELYLEIDYSDIHYITDTGRNWKSEKDNHRDKVDSKLDINYESGLELLLSLKGKKHNKIVFQIHPERWSFSNTEYYTQAFIDKISNFGKSIIGEIR